MKALLATDHSRDSSEAAWLLARIPFRTPLDLTILHSVTLPPMPAAVGMHPSWPRIIENLEAEALQKTEEQALKFRGMTGEVKSVVRRGRPADEILHEAETTGPDLVVLGAAGHSTFDRVMLGSVSDRVATHAACQTLVVRPTGHTASRAIRVLVCHDESDVSHNAADMIGSLDWGSRAEITLLHVTQVGEEARQDLFDSLSELWLKERERAEAGLRKMADAFTDRGLHAETKLVTAPHAGIKICQQAKELEADLVVLGDRGIGAVRRFLLGSTSRYVLRHCNSSVWIWREKTA